MFFHNKICLLLLYSIITIHCIAQDNPERDSILLCHHERRVNITDPIASPSILVVNLTLRPTIETSFDTWKHHNKLSSHYIIDTDGKLYKGISEQLEEIPMVHDAFVINKEYLKLRAWHTGVGYWNGDKQEITNINTHSIGILFVNKGTDDNKNANTLLGDPTNTSHWYDFTAAQLHTFIILSKQLKEIYNIADKDIVGYAEVRTDKNGSLQHGTGPGPKFPWQQAAEKGVGLYHTLTEEQLSQPCQTSIKELQDALHAWGYSIPTTEENNEQTSAAIKQLNTRYDAFYYNPECEVDICRASHIIKNLLAQHYAQKTLTNTENNDTSSETK